MDIGKEFAPTGTLRVAINAFLARDPKRAEVIAFSAPYILIEGSYLVREDSDFLCNEDVDKPGVRIAVGKGAAYDLYLSRNLQHATLERAPTTPGAVDLFLEQNLDVAAGVRQPLNEYAARHDGVRVLPGRTSHGCSCKQGQSRQLSGNICPHPDPFGQSWRIDHPL